MDGVGVGTGDAFDACSQAETPNLDALRDTALCTLRARRKCRVTAMVTWGTRGWAQHPGAGRIFDQGASAWTPPSSRVRYGVMLGLR